MRKPVNPDLPKNSYIPQKKSKKTVQLKDTYEYYDMVPLMSDILECYASDSTVSVNYTMQTTYYGTNKNHIEAGTNVTIHS